MSFAVIQGSSKGIGLAITRHLLANSKFRVVATTSQKNTDSVRESALSGLRDESDGDKRLTTLPLDVTDEASINKAKDEIHDKLGRNMRLLVNVSGVLHAEKSLNEVDAVSLLKSFNINTLGHLLVYKQFVSLIPERQKKHTESPSIFLDDGEEDTSHGILPRDRSTLVSFTARVGSIADNKKGGWYSYRSSKAATNQIIRTLSHELSMRSIPATSFAYHPGTVKTGLASPYVGKKEANESEGLFEPEGAAEKFVGVLKGVTAGKVENGMFVDWRGKEVPW